MSDRRSYHPWSAEDIHRYLSEDMSVSELTAFENSMKDDPFLRDAVEGYQGHSRIHIDHHIQRLKDHFQPKDSAGLSIPKVWWGLAASLIVGVVVWYTLPNMMNPGNEMAAHNDVAENPEPDVGVVSMRKDGAAPQLEQSLLDSMAVGDSLLLVDLSQEDNMTERNVSITRRAFKKRTPGIKGVVSGTVLDVDGHPIDGASVFFPQNQAHITTNEGGSFHVLLNAPETIAVVNQKGFVARRFTLDNQGDLGFVLEKDAMAYVPPELDKPEVKIEDVSTYDKTTSSSVQLSDPNPFDKISIRQNQTPPESFTTAMPSKGYKRYDRYISRSMRYPEEARAAGIQGDVIIQFKVAANGLPYDIEVIQNLGYGCDEEAIRLIKEGDTWQPAQDRMIARVKYTVSFKLN